VSEEYAIRKGCPRNYFKGLSWDHHGFDMEGVDVTVQGHRMVYNPEATADTGIQVKEFLAKHMR
jgi:hypothetical protein